MNDDIQALLDRIAADSHTEADLAALGRAIRVSGQGNVIQVGKYNVQIGVGQNIRIGDTIYQESDAAAIRSALRTVLAQANLDPTTSRLMQAQITQIVEYLDNLQGFWKSAYAEWQRQLAFCQVQQIRNALFDFSDHIVDKTSGFVGRTFIFDHVDELISRNRRGYIRIKGDPGIGKSALAAQIVKKKGYCHHFNIAAIGLSDTSAFRKSMIAQLVAQYALDESLWSDNPDQALFTSVLRQAARKSNEKGEKLILTVDALDEADSDFRTNTLGLPTSLPDGVFFVTTERENDPRVRIGVDPEQWSATISINPLSAQNMNDIEVFLDQSLSKPGIRIYLDRYRACEAEFVKIMKDKSAGNFMYLRYAIDDIERGAYDDDEPSHLPQGLEEYYESHLRRMREHSGSEWYMYKLPIICAIAGNPHPVTLDMILTHAGLMDSNETEQTRKRAIAADILVEWGAFVQRVKINGAAGPVIGYSFYHESFRHFLRKRTGMSIRESRVYDQVRRNIATDLTKKIFGES